MRRKGTVCLISSVAEMSVGKQDKQNINMKILNRNMQCYEERMKWQPINSTLLEQEIIVTESNVRLTRVTEIRVIGQYLRRPTVVMRQDILAITEFRSQQIFESHSKPNIVY